MSAVLLHGKRAVDRKDMWNIAIISEGCGGKLPIPNVRGGAVETWITDLIRQNEKAEGCHFDVFSCYDKEAKRYHFKNTKIRYFKTTWLEKMAAWLFNAFMLKALHHRTFFLPYNWKVAHMTDWSKYDFILVENGASIYEEICKRPGTSGKMIYHLRNDIECVDEVPWAERSDVRMRLISKTAVEVLTVSDFIRKRFLEYAPTEHIRTFYNCVDTERYSRKNAKNTAKIKKKYRIRDTNVVFMYSGRVMKEKGVLEAAKAFAMIADECENAIFIIAGRIEPKSYGTELRKAIRGLEDRVRFTGRISPYKMQEFYALADVLVAPTITEEAFGMITVEAMAMEIPLIVTDSGGMGEIVTEKCAITVYRNGELVKEIASAMRKLYYDDSGRVHMGRTGRQIIMDTYDFRKEFLHKRMIALFEELKERKESIAN